jgi:hypothetical protein
MVFQEATELFVHDLFSFSSLLGLAHPGPCYSSSALAEMADKAQVTLLIQA